MIHLESWQRSVQSTIERVTAENVLKDAHHISRFTFRAEVNMIQEDADDAQKPLDVDGEVW